jgi:phosphoglycolate phosphatase-like HAD superfamily hydrolase
MKSKTKNIFLDLDGTLLDIESRYLNLFEYMCKIFQINKISSSEFWEQKRSGETNIQILSQLDYDKNLSVNFHNKWVSLIEENFWLGFDSLQIDTVDFLNWLIEKEFKIFLLTGRNNRQSLIQQLKKLGIHHYFENIFNVDTSEMVVQKKFLLEEHKPEFFIGDSEFDYFACNNSSIKFFCVSNGFRNKNFLEANNIPNINENLKEVVKNL